MVGVASNGLAADRSWTNTAGGNFTTNTNWLNGLLAGVNDVACFNNSSLFFPPGQATYTVNFGANAQTQAIKVRNDFVTFNLLGRTYTTTNVSGNEIGTVAGGGSIQTARSARLTIQNGTFTVGGGSLSSSLTLGAATGGLGSLNVTTGGVLNGSARLLVGGASAAGSLTVNGGTILANSVEVGSGAAGVGTAIITGPFSNLTSNTLFIGNQGNGTMLISVGGTVQSNGTAMVGNALGATGRLTVDGATAQWLQPTGSLIVGASGAGNVNLINGGRIVGLAAVVGSGTTGTGSATVSGPNSRWINSATFLVGQNGSGTVNVLAGGLLQTTSAVMSDINNFDSSHATVTVDGSGSRWINSGSLLVGREGAGTLLITGGGTVQTNGAILGQEMNAFIAMVTVDGAGSRWINTGSLIVAENSTQGSRLAITNEGIVETTTAAIGQGSTGNGVVTVDGLGSQWKISDVLTVASGGDGSLNISGGGHVQARDVTLGLSHTFSPTGVVIVDGTGSQLTTNTVTIGDAGSGSLSIVAGGTVQDTDGFVGRLGGSTGIVSVGGTGSTWTNSGNLYIGGDVTAAGGAANLNVNPGGLVTVADTLTVWNNGIVNLNGGELVVGSITFPGSTFNFNLGLLRFNGDAAFNGPFLNKILGASHTIGPLQHLAVAGTATLTAPLVLDGGIFSVGSLPVGSPLQFDSGTFNLTTDNLTIGNAGLFGNAVVLDDHNINVTNSTTIQSGGQLIMQGGNFSSGAGITNNGEIAVDAPFNASFQNAIVNNGEVRVSTGATVRFFGNVSGSGNFTGAGTKFFESGTTATLGALDTPGQSVVETGATLTAARIREQSLTVNGTARILPSGTGAGTSRLNSLAVAPSGRLDLADNDLVNDYTGPSPLSQIRQLLISGRSGGNWNGNGITSSAAAAHPSHATTLGVLESADYIAATGATIFSGQPIDNSAVLIMYTWYGDSDFNGVVNFDDYSRLDAGFNAGRTGWLNGDFDLTGAINFDDYALIDLAFNTQNGTLVRAISYANGDDRSLRGMADPALQMLIKHEVEFGASYRQSFLAAVPEPASVALTALAVTTAISARRRRRVRPRQ